MVLQAGTLDLEALKGKSRISDEDNALIAEQAYKEMEQDKNKKSDELSAKEIPENKPKEKTDDELAGANDEELTPEEVTKKSGILADRKQKEDERLLSTKDEELKDEEKAQKAALLKAKDDAAKKAAEDEVGAYSKENNLSPEAAKEELEHIKKIQEKYKDDPKQLAKATLHLQRAYTKAQETLKASKPKEEVPQEVSIEAVVKAMEEGRLQNNGKPISKDEIIEAYRQHNPDITEALEDDKVLKLAAKDYKAHYEKVLTEYKAQLTVKARQKREELLSALSETDKQYLPEVKPLIEGLEDAQIMSEDFNIETYVAYAKGKSFDEAVDKLKKEKDDFGKKEYERGLQEAKIIGEKRGPKDGGAPKPKSDITLTEAQKKRAREMFDNPGITEETAYQMYKDYLKETKND